MRIIKKSILLLTSSVLLGTVAGCKAKELVIPSVDVTELSINLPTLPTRNVGSIRSDADYEYIDLYELSDFHGAVNYEPGHSSGDYIGLAKLATFFDEKRESNPGGTLVLSSGDMFQGSADSNLTRGYMVNYSMQYMGFDAMAVGNHEFDWTETWLKNNAELKYNTSSIPFLGANIQKTADGKVPDYLKSSVVVERGDYKIGIIGVIGSELENSILKSAIEGFEFVKYQTIVDNEAARLKSEEGCNAVVLLAHEAADKIEVTTGVDAYFGGHAHVNTTSKVNGKPSLATLNYGQSVAHISLKFNKSSKAIVEDGAEYETITMASVGAQLAENADIKNIMSQYAPAVDEIKNIKLGKCNEELEYDKALKNICTKSMHEAAVKAAENMDIDTSKIVVSYHNVKGGIRDNIAKGVITYGSVYKALPFDNEVVLIKIKGKLLKEKIMDLNGYGLYRTFSKKSELDNDTDYYVVTTDYLALAETFSNAFNLTEADLIRTGKVVRDEVAAKIYSVKNVKNSKWNANEECYKAIPRY